MKHNNVRLCVVNKSKEAVHALFKGVILGGLITEKASSVQLHRLLNFYEDLQKGNDTRLVKKGPSVSDRKVERRESNSSKFSCKKVTKKYSEFTTKDVAKTLYAVLCSNKKLYEVLEENDMTVGQYQLFIRELYNNGTICGTRVLNYNNIGKPDSKNDLFRFAKGYKLTLNHTEEEMFGYTRKLDVLLMRLKRSLININKSI